MSFIDDFLASWREYRKPGYYDEFDYHWTMSVDLDRCTGCEACVTACQARTIFPSSARMLLPEAGKCSGFASNGIGKANFQT